MKKFDLKLGFKCQNDCQHCVVADKRQVGDLTTDEILKLIPNDVDQVILTGGEPTIRTDFILIIKYLKEEFRVPFVALQTNGRAFKSLEFTKAAVKYIDHILVAIHSHVEEIHDRITQRKGSWQETIQGIKNLKKLNANVGSQTIISKYNFKYLPQTFEFIQFKLGIKNMNLTFPHPNGNAFRFFNNVVPTYSEIKPYIDEIIIKFKDKLYIEAIPKCYLHPLVSDLKINEYKDLTGGYDKSNRNQLIENYNPLIMSEHRKSDICKYCIYNNECIGVWKEYFKHEKIDLIPITDEFKFPITIRTKSFKKFLQVLDNFVTVEPALIKNLIVFAFNYRDNELKALKEAADKMFFKYIMIHNKENWLKAALSFKKVISISEKITLQEIKLLRNLEFDEENIIFLPNIVVAEGLVYQ